MGREAPGRTLFSGAHSWRGNRYRSRPRYRSSGRAVDGLRVMRHTTIENDNDDQNDNDYYISVAPASARGLRSPFVRQT
jgi:hypothetical protein